MKAWKMLYPVLVFVLGTISLSACTAIGPDTVRGQRVNYNLAVQRTNDQELLLNIVRLRYRDTLYFLGVERIAATLEYEPSASLGATLPAGGSASYTGSLGLRYNDNPTIFFTPLDGEKFVRQLMKPLDPDLILLLSNSGWSLERVFALCLMQMNGLANAPSASGPTPLLEPQYKEYRQAIHALRELQNTGYLVAGRLPGTDPQLEVRIDPAAHDMPAAAQLRAMLGISNPSDVYVVKHGFGRSNDNTIYIAPRSLMAVLSYLSQGVNPPESDFKAGRVTRTMTADGKVFDWQEVLGGLMKIDSSETQPENASVAVEYRGHWFYIRDNDLESKSTFALISQIFTLQAGSSAVQGTTVGFSISK